MMWYVAGALIVLLCGLLAAVAVYDSSRFVTVSYRISDRRIRGRVRLILLADLHNRQYGAGNAALLQAIRAQKPDLILCAGDMVTSVKEQDQTPAEELLRTLAGEFPVCFTDGNHEQRIFSDPQAYGDKAERLRRCLQESGIRYLQNESIHFPSLGLRVYGLCLPEDTYRKLLHPCFSPKQLESLAGKVIRDDYVLLLAHNPDFFETYAAWGADLTLSGHLHGGIVRLPFVGGVLSTSLRLFPKYDGGLFEKDGRRMVVSRGMGSHTIPIRLFNPAELVVIDLVPKEEDETDDGAGSKAGSL